MSGYSRPYLILFCLTASLAVACAEPTAKSSSQFRIPDAYIRAMVLFGGFVLVTILATGLLAPVVYFTERKITWKQFLIVVLACMALTGLIMAIVGTYVVDFLLEATNFEGVTDSDPTVHRQQDHNH